MRRTLVYLSTVLASLAAGPGTAGAGPTVDDVLMGRVEFAGAAGGVAWRGTCLLAATTQQAATGVTIEGAAVGAAVALRPDTGLPQQAAFRCYVTVNGIEVASTSEARAPGATAGRFTYAASAADDMALCAEIDSAAAPACNPLAPVTAHIDPVVNDALDPFVCWVLPIVRGVPGVLTVTEDGDVYVFGSRKYDCAPYGD